MGRSEVKSRTVRELHKSVTAELLKANTILNTAKERSLAQRSVSHWVIRTANLQFMKEYIEANTYLD